MSSYAQLSLHLPITAAAIRDHGLIPARLGREVAVKLCEPSLLMTDERAASHIRQGLSPEQISAEINRISELAAEREEFGDYAAFSFEYVSNGYACIDSARSALNWMYEHERKRINQLKLALPSQAECVIAARQRIQARIAARKNRAAQAGRTLEDAAA